VVVWVLDRHDDPVVASDFGVVGFIVRARQDLSRAARPQYLDRAQ